MHEVLLGGGAAALAGSFAALWVRASWLRRRRTLPLRVGDRAPALEPLMTLEGSRFDKASLRDAACLVIVFMSNTCPGVKAYDARLKALADRYAPAGVRFVGVNSVHDGNYPSESLEGMATAARARSLPFPYLKDQDQELARAFGALCTPHIFLCDRDHRLRYRGRIDDALLESRAKKHYLRDAIEDVLHHRVVSLSETAPLGCAIEIIGRPITLVA